MVRIAHMLAVGAVALSPAKAFMVGGMGRGLAPSARTSLSQGLRSPRLAMSTIAPGVEFDTIAREWRMKWSGDNDKASLVKCQEELEKVLPEIKGLGKVQRVVCGGCLDFKVITALPADKFGDWEGKEFAPEAAFLEAVKKIDGVSLVETQTYTLMEV